ncbi:hypothetical protein [Leuconostoc mesenteroides]|jgi:hypothetical protein|uniref:Uncharacterized protein n=1 Tax=Leuconostoc mesenteroides subsp. mesenteroides (strain ATCC 8293 / DSM 20343 / BCRC 11652 / CCM 1803 / JCM 6124 / NCDO 523 / NBRC 100496 / NCIMB 8023 / NCTC 12954 / NRRL B-1118 / 37Y) TaxID=203120 RepID=Q03WR7_LEUMM|nr:hypothetical protein [Leuconostoc mesenteroides]ABJ62355.1 hypothetical protein LEUM_1258 [Leuconostoc mesenteroides subsp. mesenteroides ATCC 8293]MCJ2158963.1 hypothetical protein [Leuconostoc mesenteroides]MCM6835612.1 hypothetical protein [Leuconostoc mesenteroides]MCT3042722.1 hypothetical protein [Leuconostoc mesenteroides]MCT3045413.1 hypothetical protein [Leuconostoc mesenteroides]
MTIKEQKQRKIKLAKYIQQLDEFNWHHPAQANEMADSQYERDKTNYYTAQMALVLKNNYEMSYNNIDYILQISVKHGFDLIKKYKQDFSSLEEIQEALENGEDW